MYGLVRAVRAEGCWREAADVKAGQRGRILNTTSASAGFFKVATHP
jgi:hypothetical protein